MYMFPLPPLPCPPSTPVREIPADFPTVPNHSDDRRDSVCLSFIGPYLIPSAHYSLPSDSDIPALRLVLTDSRWNPSGETCPRFQRRRNAVIGAYRPLPVRLGIRGQSLDLPSVGFA